MNAVMQYMHTYTVYSINQSGLTTCVLQLVPVDECVCAIHPGASSGKEYSSVLYCAHCVSGNNHLLFHCTFLPVYTHMYTVCIYTYVCMAAYICVYTDPRPW